MGVDRYSDRADFRMDIFEFNPPDECADEILANHLIEHIPMHRAPEALTKWLKTLKPGGKLVMEQPDLAELCKDFLAGENQHETTVCIYGAAVENPDDPEIKEKGALSPHLWGYTPKTLKDLVEAVGFKEVNILAAQGNHPGKNFRLEAVKG
jgi:hypothetical protein